MINIPFQITCCITVNKLHRTFDQLIHDPVLIGYFLKIFFFSFCFCDITYKNQRITGRIPGRVPDDHISYPAHISVHQDPALQTDLFASLFQLPGNISPIIKMFHHFTVFPNHISIRETTDHLIPCDVFLEQPCQLSLHFHGIKTVFFKIHIIFTDVGFRVRAMKSIYSLGVLRCFFLFINIYKNSRHMKSGSIRTAADFALVPEPLITAVCQTHPVFHIIFCLICTIPKSIIKSLVNHFNITGMYSCLPGFQAVGKIQYIVVSQHFSKFMTEKNICGFSMLITFHRPEA